MTKRPTSSVDEGFEIAPLIPQLSIQLGYAHFSRRNCAKAKVAFARALDISPWRA